MTRKRSFTAVAFTAVVTLSVLTACGESASTGSSTSSSSSSSSSNSSSSSSVSSSASDSSSAGGSASSAAGSSGGSGDAAIGAQFTGGKAGAASGNPIKIGLINQEGGAVSDPEVRVAIEAAFKYANAEQSGVGGRELQLETCNVLSSEEEAQQCAQKFVNDSAVPVVLQGGLNTGTQSVHSTINGAKPTIVTLANPGTDATAKNTFAMNPGALSGIAGTATYMKSQNLKSISLISSSNAGDLQIVGFVKQTLKGAGLTVDTASYPEGTTDLSSALVASKATSNDLVSPVVVTPAACVAFAQTATQNALKTPVLASGLCSNDAVKSQLGDLPQWTYETTTLNLYAQDDTGQVTFYKDVMGKYGNTDQLGVGAPAAFGAAFALIKILNTVGADKITSDSVTKATQAFTGPVLLGTPKLKFGSINGSPALGSNADRYYTYKGNNNWIAATQWQNLPS